MSGPQPVRVARRGVGRPRDAGGERDLAHGADVRSKSVSVPRVSGAASAPAGRPVTAVVVGIRVGQAVPGVAGAAITWRFRA